MSPIVSICIPSYNRPNELIRLLESIDVSCSKEIEIVICEDNSPKRNEIQNKVEEFKINTILDIQLNLNRDNLGYDGNLRNLINLAKGEYIIFMGDDDQFYTPNFLPFINFLKKNKSLGYILKTHKYIHTNGQEEMFKYYPETKFFKKGSGAYQELFRKSVFISGFCLKREYALPYQTDRFDGGLLYQLYLLAEITLNHPSAYCDIPLTFQDEQLRGKPMFGSSNAERLLYKPGEITVDNSLNFVDNFFSITKYIDSKYHLKSTDYIRKDISKYSYPILSIQRTKGRKIFKYYCNQLKIRIKINSSFYYYVYYYSLLVFGKSFCDQTIVRLKKTLGSTPNL